MKRTFLAALFCCFSLFAFSQVSVGDYIPLVKGIVGSYQPKVSMAVAEINGFKASFMNVLVCNGGAYREYDSESRVLFKFADDSKFTLPISAGMDVDRHFSCESANGVLYNLYYTSATYDLSDEFLTKLLADEPITKVRIVFTNGEIVDVEIKRNYQADLTQLIKTSYLKAVAENQQRRNNMSDDDF